MPSFLAPLSLLLALLAVPIILLYMLRLRRREVLVSSTLLWQRLLRDREANAPWQRLRRNLLLLLQLLILALLVLALARPYLPVPTIVQGNVVVLLDGSASMLATDVAPSRFAAARAEVAAWIDDLGAGDQMTLIQVGHSPEVLATATGDRRVLQAALEAAEAAPVVADWEGALALAGGAAQGFEDARIVIVSDGGLPPALPPLPGETVYVPVGESGENLALTALAPRAGVEGPQLFAAVANLGTLNQEALVTIEVAGTLFDSRRIEVAAGETRSLTWDLPAEVSTVAARVGEQTLDYLAVDDRAWAVYEAGLQNRALLIGPGNLFLEQLYAVLPGIELFQAPPGVDLQAEAPEGVDLFIFDSVPLPETLPQSDMLILNPQPTLAPEEQNEDLLRVTGAFSATTVTRLAESPLLANVDWSDVDVRRAQAVSAPWAEPLVVAEGGPLLLAGEWNGRRVAILTFALQDSDLPLQIAFPVLMANITTWLSPGRLFDAPVDLQPGDPLPLTPDAGATAVLVSVPGGATRVEAVDEEALLFTDTGQPGLYQVAVRDAAGDRPAGAFAVNFFAPSESAIAPEPVVQIGVTTARAAAADVGQRELWPWLAGVALVLLMIEWWVHFRGARLPRLNVLPPLRRR
ncbi:MAG: VWA domain-containing protein [Candidatus Promineifilaceae bacterium]|nr:VWA domain-containing protein [Candidatus Promineifilaceae bacterium]